MFFFIFVLHGNHNNVVDGWIGMDDEEKLASNSKRNR